MLQHSAVRGAAVPPDTAPENRHGKKATQITLREIHYLNFPKIFLYATKKSWASLPTSRASLIRNKIFAYRQVSSPTEQA